MKKLAALGILCALLAAPSLSYAQNVKGAVVSVDSAANQIVIQDMISGSSKTVRVHPNVILSLNVGTIVNVTLGEGNVADTIEVEMA